jgi:hypothetical protein
VRIEIRLRDLISENQHLLSDVDNRGGTATVVIKAKGVTPVHTVVVNKQI